MKEKTLSTILLFIVFSLSLHSQTDRKSYDLLWRLEKDDKVSFLFGTMHVKDERVFQFSDSVMLAIEACDYFALELHSDSIFNQFTAEDLEQIDRPEDLLTHDEFQKLKKKFKKQTGADYENFDINNSISLREILSKEVDERPQRETFVDAYLLGIAKTLQKEIRGLEKLEDQISFFSGRDENRSELLEFIEENSKAVAQFDDFIATYAKGSLSNLIQFTGTMEEDSVMVKRNNVMANSIDKFHKKGSIFSAVGAAHLIGEESVLNLLKEKGFNVQRVQAQFTGVAEKYKIDPLKMKWYTLENPEKGYQIRSPGPLIPAKGQAFEMIDMHTLIDLTGNSSFFTFNIDLRLFPDKDEKEVRKLFLKEFIKKKESKIINKFKKDGLEITELLIQADDGSKGRMRYLVNNKILYCYAVFGFFEDPYPPEQDKYFESFKVIQKEELVQNTELWTNEKASFEVAFKSEPKYSEQLVPVEMDSETIDIPVMQYTEIDFSNSLIKIVSYNDLVVGYYVESAREQLSDVFIQLSQNSEILSTPDTIQVDGYEAWRFKVNVQNQYPGEILIMCRGNRYYSVLEMGMTEGDVSDELGKFIDTFGLVENQEATLKVNEFKDLNFAIKTFDERKSITPIYTDNQQFYDSIISVSFQNPNSAGHYVLQKIYLKDFIRYDNEDSLLWEITNSFLEWSDSLSYHENFKIEEYHALKIDYIDLYTDEEFSNIAWFDGSDYYHLQAEIEREEYDKNYFEEIVNSFKTIKPVEKKNLSSSKSELITNGLFSDDSLKYQESLGSFNYYYWQEDEFSQLIQLFESNFKDDQSLEGVKSRVLDELLVMNDSASYAALNSNYSDLSDDLKEKALVKLLEFDNDNKFINYVEKIKNEPPLNNESNYFSLFQPFRDSIDLFKKQFSTLMDLSKKGAYKKEIITLCVNFLKEHPSFEGNVQANMSHLTENAFAHFEEFKEDFIHDESVNYNLITPYLELSERVNHPSFVGPYVNLLNTLENEWIANESLEAVLFNNLPVQKSKLKKEFKNTTTRYEIIEVMQRANRLEEVPSKYLSQEALSLTALTEFIDLDGYNCDKYKLLGTLENSSEIYYCYELEFKYARHPYLGIAGPFSQGQTPKLKDLNAYTDWSKIEDNWKNQATEMIPSLKDFGLKNYY